VAEIARMRLPAAHLAYLSACGTAQAATHLRDEVLHVSSAFHAAGFSHVVATLWPVADSTALEFATAFYDRLEPIQLTHPAYAVHAATRQLRDRHQGRAGVSWAGHIHSGC
jgi:CHAT domain-containing protein